MKAAEADRARLAELSNQIEAGRQPLISLLDRADKSSLAETDCTDLVNRLENEWTMEPLRTNLADMQQLDAKEAGQKQDELNQLQQKRDDWLCKLKERLGLYALFRQEQNDIGGKLEGLHNSTAQLQPTAENIPILQV